MGKNIFMTLSGKEMSKRMWEQAQLSLRIERKEMKEKQKLEDIT